VRDRNRSFNAKSPRVNRHFSLSCGALRAIIIQLIISLQKSEHTVPISALWQHSVTVAGLRNPTLGEDDCPKLDGWWFIFVDEVPGLGVLGPNYEDLLERLKVVAGNLFRARGETIAVIEIGTRVTPVSRIEQNRTRK
jgi:predicted RNase H-like HicB family nuclease